MENDEKKRDVETAVNPLLDGWETRFVALGSPLNREFVSGMWVPQVRSFYRSLRSPFNSPLKNLSQDDNKKNLGTEMKMKHQPEPFSAKGTTLKRGTPRMTPRIRRDSATESAVDWSDTMGIPQLAG